MGKQIANSVPVKLATALAREIRDQLRLKGEKVSASNKGRQPVAR